MVLNLQLIALTFYRCQKVGCGYASTFKAVIPRHFVWWGLIHWVPWVGVASG